MSSPKTGNRSGYRDAIEKGRNRIGSVLGAETPTGRVTVTIPNYMTLGRLFIVPIFWYGLLSPNWWLQATATILMALGAISDLWDGRIARKRGEVTAFGDFMDPLADKLLVLSGFWAILVKESLGDFWPVITGLVMLITLREFVITLLRVRFIQRGSSVKTSRWGKWKTGVQLTALLTTLVWINARDFLVLSGYSGKPLIGAPFDAGVTIMFAASAITSLISGYLYIRPASSSRAS